MRYVKNLTTAVGSSLLAVCFSFASSSAFAQEEQYAESIKIYNTYCVQCHGINRDGQGINSEHMSVQPRDHTDSQAMGDTPDDTLFRAIKEGGLAVSKSVLMPAWGGVLSDEEITNLVSYLRFISETE